MKFADNHKEMQSLRKMQHSRKGINETDNISMENLRSPGIECGSGPYPLRTSLGTGLGTGLGTVGKT